MNVKRLIIDTTLTLYIVYLIYYYGIKSRYQEITKENYLKLILVSCSNNTNPLNILESIHTLACIALLNYLEKETTNTDLNDSILAPNEYRHDIVNHISS